jgi:Ni,Fe-hydrogenase III large subunit
MEPQPFSEANDATMSGELFKIVQAVESARIADVPDLHAATFRKAMIEAVRAGRRISAFFGKPESDGTVRLFAVIASDEQGLLYLTSCGARGTFPSIAPECPQIHLFEREITENTGLIFEGHPWPRPVRKLRSSDSDCGPDDFFRVAGESVHEVAVGPVHAGVIEPGHFRFQCHGEKVFHLEIALGYQHRGIEAALIGGPDRRTIHLIETLAGDTTIAHTIAHCHILESLGQCRIPLRAQSLRAVALELERLANHTGDLGALANDVAFLPTAAYCGRTRGDFLNLTAYLCGNRFGRNLVRPGGVAYDLESDRIPTFLQRLASTYEDTRDAVDLLFAAPSVRSRFENTGKIDRKLCRKLGLVGPAARASGIRHDVRNDFPTGIYKVSHLPVVSCETGDVHARGFVRWLEIRSSTRFIKNLVPDLPSGQIFVPCAPPKPEMIVVAMVEGWRGEVCHVAMTGEDGRFSMYKVVDPSFHNWSGLAMALRNEEISNFPLCNKSFNLSYCGHDL